MANSDSAHETSLCASSVVAFKQLRGLVGVWRGVTPAGAPIGVTYRLSAGDSVLVETWNLGPGRESMTVYHLDGAALLASHFCPQGNQPRLKMIQSTGSRFDFAFHDATGILPGQAVQRAFWIEIGTDRAITRSETYVQDDESETETIRYERVGG